MGSLHRAARVFALTVFLFGPLTLTAEETRYNATFSGVPLGTAVLVQQMADGHYVAHLQVKNKGIMRMFKEHESSTRAEGWLDGKWTPSAYVSDYRLDEKKKFISLQFDEDGTLIEREIQPPDPDRPEVAAEKIVGAVDPLTALLQMPERLEEQLAADRNSVRLRLYDGKRLMDVYGTIDAQATAPRFLDRKSVIALSLRRSAVAGFTPKETKKLARENALTLYYTRTDPPALIGATMPVAIGEVQIRKTGITAAE